MKWLACFGAAAAMAFAQSGGALLSNQDALKLEQRAVQLIESTGLAVPGLTRAGAPALEDARQALANLEQAPRNAGNTFAFLGVARAYLAISDTLPKPYPFPEEGRRQFGELRDAVDRLDAHFRALLDLQQSELHNPDPDNLKRYAEANQKLGAPAPQKPRVVFLGDSITDLWRLNEYYGSERDFVNRGISGQITSEMLGRMQADVIDLKPRAVLVLGGINDLARGAAVTTVESNLSMIADLAEVHHIQPLFASVLPVGQSLAARLPAGSIQAVNTWLRSFCEQRHFPYVDYYQALADKSGLMPADLADDGVHPNARGYRLMAPIALAAIDNLAAASAKAPPAKKKAGIRAWLEKEH